MTPEDLFELYRNHFIPVYSDFVALALMRSEQVLVEESNILSHIAQFFDPQISEALRQTAHTTAWPASPIQNN